MGDMADYYRDQQFNEEFEYNYHKLPNEEYIWLTSDGVEYKVKDMTDSHIQNTLRCLDEGRISFDTGYELTLWIKIMKEECKRRSI